MLVEDHLEPKTTDLPAAPEQLLEIVGCNCRTDSASLEDVLAEN